MKKKSHLPLLPKHIIQCKMATNLYLSSIGKAIAIILPEPLFIRIVKGQILSLKAKLDALQPMKGFRRSTYMIRKQKKIRIKTIWLMNYFINSTTAMCPRGRTTRKVNSNAKRNTPKEKNKSCPATQRNPTYLKIKKRRSYLKILSEDLIDYVSSLRSHHDRPYLNHDVEYLSVDRNVASADLASKVYVDVLCSHSDLHPI